jgi:type II secretory pathway component PulJ
LDGRGSQTIPYGIVCGFLLQLLGALAILLVLAIAGFWFTKAQQEQGEAVEEQRARDAALQAYFGQMGTLLLVEELRKSEEGSGERTLARARTISVLGPRSALVSHAAALVTARYKVGESAEV